MVVIRLRHQTVPSLLALVPIILQLQQVAGQYIPDAPRPHGSQDVKRDSQSSSSREIYIAGHDDFCLFGPATSGPALSQGDRNVVSWCNKEGHNSRMIPKGALTGVTYIKAQNWVQVSGVGDLTKINIKPGDWGGQFDSLEHTPEGAKVMGGADKKEASSWVTLMSPDLFCFRACFGDASYCPTTFADKGCYDLLSNGVGPDGTFQSCTSKDGLPPAKQGDHAPEWMDCKTGDNDGGGVQPAWAGGPGSSKAGESSKSSIPSPSTSWVGVPTCIPCTGASSSSASSSSSPTSPSASTPAPSTSAPSSSTQASSGTVQQGVTKVTEGVVAKEGTTSMPSFIPAPSSGALVLKRAEETVTKDGQCCFTTWTPTVIGAGGAGPTASAQSSGSVGGAITGVTPVNVSGSSLITNSSGTVSGTGTKPSGNATVSGSGKNGTNGTNGTHGNGTESYASRTLWGAEGSGVGWSLGGVAVAVVWTLAGGWAVL